MTATTLVAAVVAALANVVGAALVTGRRVWNARDIDVMIAFSGGFMISVAVVDMIPDAVRAHGLAAGWMVLAGYLAVHLTQHTLVPHFHFGEETHHVTRAVGISALMGLMLHMLMDGVAIASAFAAGGTVGTLVVVAIVLHKLPEGSTVSTLFVAAGFGRGKALAAAAALGLATVVGALLTEIIAPLATYGLALSGGVTVYVAASNLVPEVQRKRDWRLPLSFFGGCLVFGAGHALIAAA
ncbi:MAG: ZIP family metal transporter [Gemmatimonadota bacterium]|nr:ZIP family metal transporter [Gemmatimonadota bacterium]